MTIPEFTIKTLIGRTYQDGGVVPGAVAPPTPDLPGEYRIPCPANPAPNAESGSPTGQPLPTPVPADSLTLLIAALHEQTAAINRLASSNEALVQAMAESEDGDPDAEPRTYMDGSPVR